MSSPTYETYAISETDSGQTLAAVLKKLSSVESWGESRRLVINRHVQVNGNLCLDPSRRLTSKDTLKIWKTALPKPVSADSLKLVFVDDEIIVVEKPAGITSVRHFEEQRMRKKRRQLQPTLEELIPLALSHFLRKRRLESRLEARGIPKEDIGQNKRKGPRDLQRLAAAAESLASRLNIIAVHRLDRDTSGLMIFARTRRTATLLGQSFRKHAIDRRYFAVVKGHPTAQTFDNQLIRDRGDGHRGSTGLPNAEGAQRAITHVRPIESIGEYSIVECKLETGRTHQIRIHLSEAGYPICGDLIYWKAWNGGKGPKKQDKSHAPRQALHSSTLRFVHPTTGEVMKFEMPWPRDLERWIEGLRQQNHKDP